MEKFVSENLIMEVKDSKLILSGLKCSPGGEVIDCESDQGTEVTNERCANCSHPFVESEWR